jgi:multicomponent Na+:H+ antiporter subunit E
MAAKTTAPSTHSRKRAEIVHFVFLTSALFVFWFILSGKTEARYLIIGFVTALAITVAARPLLILPPDQGRPYWLSLWDLPWPRVALYIPWLIWQIIVANIQMAMIILHPKLPVDPKVVQFRKHISHPVGRLALANSITLTPGTITLDLEEDGYTIHCLQGGFAGGVVAEDGEGVMPAKVGAVFGVEPVSTTRQD